ncbi:DUF1754-domain-containing protein [Violaceomyces palustris]|uniref:DUF1754-domain-containing protein n=1 Tax=Violaceomyces palustris TaxID=1673888 RepID=A0ACD0P0M6_9BASI|nr:DUF1754-domain-containing protein [Violaceomyces palustris]
MSSSSSPYTFNPGGSLKLKSKADSDKKSSKKKKSKSSTTSDLKRSSHHNESDSVQAPTPPSQPSQITPSKTKAELKFEEIRRKRMAEKVKKEAKKSHKEKVDAFNEHLLSLSEHHDIPKVGPG